MTLSRSSSASIMSKLVVPTDDRLGSSFAIAGGARFVLDERIISLLMPRSAVRPKLDIYMHR